MARGGVVVRARWRRTVPTGASRTREKKERTRTMNDVPLLYDPTNPYETEGLSDEDHAIIQFLVDSGVPCVVTATTDHPLMTSAGNVSRHVMWGTNGKGLGVDSRGLVHGEQGTLLII